MNRWVLLQHEISSKNLIDLHYDFLIEGEFYCYTWKLNEIPTPNKGLVKIKKQSNHRLVWLSRNEYELSNNRGFVKRIDHGTYSYMFQKQDTQELKIILNGNLLNGLLVIDGNFCHLTKSN